MFYVLHVLNFETLVLNTYSAYPTDSQHDMNKYYLILNPAPI